MDENQRLVQYNMENYWKFASNTGYMTFETNTRWIKATSSGPDSVLNSVLSVKVDINKDKNVIGDLEHFYSERKQSFCWWVFPDEMEEQLSTSLKSHRFHFEGIQAGMILPNISKANLEYKLPSNVTIKTVKTDSEFDQWMRPITISFGVSESGSYVYKSIYKELSKRTDDIEHYIAYQDETPVASCTVFFDKETQTAGIYNCGTVPEARNKGICSALAKHGLFHAKDKGYETAVLQATHFSKKLFTEIGFDTCTSYKLYCK